MKSLTPNLTDYDAAVRDFKLHVPERFNYTVDVFEAQARAGKGLVLACLIVMT